MSRADHLAAELQTAIDGIHAELEAIPDERWSNSVTGPEGWRVGHAAHHIGEGYLQSLSWIDQAVSEGKPVELTPEVDLPAMAQKNARCLEAHGAQPRAETMAFMRASAARLVERVRALPDTALDAPMMVVMGQERPGAVVAGQGSLRHANGHLESIRSAP